jgi:hypothetical protein
MPAATRADVLANRHTDASKDTEGVTVLPGGIVGIEVPDLAPASTYANSRWLRISKSLGP